MLQAQVLAYFPNKHLVTCIDVLWRLAFLTSSPIELSYTDSYAVYKLDTLFDHRGKKHRWNFPQSLPNCQCTCTLILPATLGNVYMAESCATQNHHPSVLYEWKGQKEYKYLFYWLVPPRFYYFYTVYVVYTSYYHFLNYVGKAWVHMSWSQGCT